MSSKNEYGADNHCGPNKVNNNFLSVIFNNKLTYNLLFLALKHKSMFIYLDYLIDV